MLGFSSLIKSVYLVLLPVFAFLIHYQPANSQVKAWEGTITIPTYGWQEALAAWKSGAFSPKGSETQNRYIQFCTDLQK